MSKFLKISLSFAFSVSLFVIFAYEINGNMCDLNDACALLCVVGLSIVEYCGSKQ